jgi:hypothetical protein
MRIEIYRTIYSVRDENDLEAFVTVKKNGRYETVSCSLRNVNCSGPSCKHVDAVIKERK